MDSVEISFLRAQLARPDDPATRSIYADWLDERGETAKADYLRIDGDFDRVSAGDWRGWPDDAPLELDWWSDRAVGRRCSAEYPRRAALAKLRPAVEPNWWAFQETLARPFRAHFFGGLTDPTPAFTAESLPFREPLGARGSVLTFASSFRDPAAWSAGLTADLRFLLRIAGSLVGAPLENSLAGPILPFVAEWPRPASDRGVAPAGPFDVLNALRRRRVGPTIEPDEIHAERGRQRFFPSLDWFFGLETVVPENAFGLDVAGVSREEMVRGLRRHMEAMSGPYEAAHDELHSYTSLDGGSLWYGRLAGEPSVDPEGLPTAGVRFAVGRSPHGERIVGLLTRDAPPTHALPPADSESDG